MKKKMMCEENMSNRSSEFWGICCEGGKKYSQVVRQKFHMTMAALDPTIVPTSPVVSLMVDRGGCEYLLCSLKPGTLLQVNLNLYFDKGEKVTFSLIGKGKIHLSGYHIYEKNESVSATTKEKVPKRNHDKKTKKAVGSNSDEDSSEDDISEEDTSEDEDDETEDNKKDSNRLLSYKRSWSALTKDEESDEEDSDSEDYEDSDEDNEVSLKKADKEFQNKKRPKNDSSEIISNKKSEKNTLGKSRDLNDSKMLKQTPKKDLLNSSIGRTPMPQKTPKENLVNPSKAVTPKKVDFMDIGSTDSDNEENSSSVNVTPNKATEQTTTPSSETKKKKKKKKKNKAASDASNITNESPAKPKGLASASYSQKLPGGLEYEDVRVGNGPIAKKGRLVHVYYTGMLENDKIFDSREVGNKPFSFKLGSNQVIKGWDMAVEGMKVGGKRRMKIPPKLGYANARTGPIPPNSTLYFTVELKAVS